MIPVMVGREPHLPRTRMQIRLHPTPSRARRARRTEWRQGYSMHACKVGRLDVGEGGVVSRESKGERASSLYAGQCGERVKWLK